MAWYLLIGVGFLIGLCLSNAYLRHHALTLMIWVCKGTRITMNGLIWCFEFLQDRFDDIDIPTHVKEPAKPKTTAKFDFNTATDEQIREYIQKHPEEIKVKAKGGE